MGLIRPSSSIFSESLSKAMSCGELIFDLLYPSCTIFSSISRSIGVGKQFVSSSGSQSSSVLRSQSPIRTLSKTHFFAIFVTQCAAVKMYRSLMMVPPQCIPVLPIAVGAYLRKRHAEKRKYEPLLYFSATVHKNSLYFVAVPPKMRSLRSSPHSGEIGKRFFFIFSTSPLLLFSATVLSFFAVLSEGSAGLLEQQTLTFSCLSEHRLFRRNLSSLSLSSSLFSAICLILGHDGRGTHKPSSP